MRCSSDHARPSLLTSCSGNDAPRRVCCFSRGRGCSFDLRAGLFGRIYVRRASVTLERCAKPPLQTFSVDYERLHFETSRSQRRLGSGLYCCVLHRQHRLETTEKTNLWSNTGWTLRHSSWHHVKKNYFIQCAGFVVCWFSWSGLFTFEYASETDYSPSKKKSNVSETNYLAPKQRHLAAPMTI